MPESLLCTASCPDIGLFSRCQRSTSVVHPGPLEDFQSYLVESTPTPLLFMITRTSDSNVKYQARSTRSLSQGPSRTLKALSPGQKCRHNDINDYIRGFRVFIDSTFAEISFTTVDARAKFIFRLYGWFESCECGSNREGFAKIANSLKFVNWHSDNELPLDIKFEFFPLEDEQVCEVCGE